MAVSDMEAVIEFLRKNGFTEAESALKEDMIEKRNKVSDFDFDFERFVFPMVPPPRPVRIPASLRRSEGVDGEDCSRSSSVGSEEFVSLESSTSGVCSSEFTNPYGICSATRVSPAASSDRLSEFGTARDYPDSDMQNDLYWYDEKDDGDFMTPCFGGLESFGYPSEDKFILSVESEQPCENPFGLNDELEGLQSVSSNHLDKPCVFNIASMDDVNNAPVSDYYHLDKNMQPEKSVNGNSESCADYRCSVPLCECRGATGGFYAQDPVSYSHLSSKESKSNDFQLKVFEEIPTDSYSDSEYKINKSFNKRSSANDLVGGFKSTAELHIQDAAEDFQQNVNDSYEVEDGTEVSGEAHEPEAADDEGDDVIADELLLCDNNEEEYEVFNLRIIHRKNRTGFEENKDLPIVLNAIIAGRYYVTEYLGSAAFSKVVQAQDLHTGMDVCLKIIKNDKDFFDQSLDEIKLLKLVNKYDPADERHILRLYDYFYHQEHLFIVCELLRANLYEFQKFNQESGGDTYFTLRRLQVITRQCLEALDYLHHLGIIHCDLKPENILIKSYRRCEIKIIDLGSSCFKTDNLCLYVQSRSYRAPEVILGVPYDEKIDLWSLGCILGELCSGEVLFPNDGLVMLLARMIGMLGPFDIEMLVSGQETHKYFTKEYDLYYMNEDTNQLEYIIPEESSLENHLQVSDIGFIDFVRYLLEINPERRPTAAEALEHPWLSHDYELNDC